MASPLIATKLHLPVPRARVVGRPRLCQLLDRGLSARLTLLSAPAGFGKTTLPAEWLAQPSMTRQAIAWLSLDTADDEPAVFWPHVTAALRGALVKSGGGFPGLPEASVPDDAFIALLLNQLTELDHPLVLVLDDLHVIEHADIHGKLAVLLEHLPPSVRIVISTRADPALPLARLRANGDLVELRAADLRMTASEADAYLNDVMGLALSPADLKTLEQRTEGWVAALQLAVLSLQGRTDASAFIEGFAGSGRYVVDYLVEEVLQRLLEETRDFLLHRPTAPAERIAVRRGDGRARNGTRHAGSARAAEPLPRAARRASPVVLVSPPLRGRAQLPPVGCAAGRLAFYASARQRLVRGERRAGRGHPPRPRGRRLRLGCGTARTRHPRNAAQPAGKPVSRLDEADPGCHRARASQLGLGYAGVLVSLGVFEGIEERLGYAEAGLAAQDASGSLRASIELYRSALAQVRGDLPSAAGHAQAVLQLAPADDHLVIAGAAGFLGIVAWTEGDLEAAIANWTRCRDGLRHAGHVADVQGATIALVDEREALAGLLKLAARRGAAPAFVHRLLAEDAPALHPATQEHPDLIEPLSDRETDVLRLLRSDLSGPEIARELLVSLNTVRTHTRNIFDKLGVNSRRAAVRRAEEMQLFARSHAH